MIAIAKNRLWEKFFAGSNRRATRVIRQTGSAHCLDACVQMLCSHYQLPIPAGGEIRKLAGTDANGASLQGARHCLEQLGFRTTVGQCDFKLLGKLAGPAIAVVTNPDGSLHYVLVNRARFGKVEVLNPAGGQIDRYKRSQFESIWTRTLLVINAPQKTAIDLEEQASPIQFLAQLLWNYRGSVQLAALAGVFQVSLVIAGLLMLREFISGIAYHVSTTELVGLLIGFLLCAIFKFLFFDCYERVRNGIQRRIALNLELQATDHLQQLTTDSINRADSFELAQRSRTDGAAIAQACASLADAMVQVLVVMLLLSTIAILDDSGYVFMFALAVAVSFPALAYLPSRKLARLKQTASETNNLVRKQVAETIAGARLLRRMGASTQRASEIRRLQLQAFTANAEYTRTRSRSRIRGTMVGGIVATAALTIAWTASMHDPGLVISHFILINMMSFALKKISAEASPVGEYLHIARRYLDLLSEHRERIAFASQPATGLRGQRLRLENVGLGAVTGLAAPQEISLELKSGETILLTDPTGKQNEALARLLTSQETAATGRILVDSINMADLSKEQVQHLIGYTPADPYIFQASLLRNISPASQSVEIPELHRIAEETGLYRLVEKLPQRFDTVIGRKGVFTTWDERYRVGLARLGLKEPPMVVLELPNYALPNELVQTINELIATRWRHRIVIVLSTQAAANIDCQKKLRFNRFGQLLATR